MARVSTRHTLTRHPSLVLVDLIERLSSSLTIANGTRTRPRIAFPRHRLRLNPACRCQYCLTVCNRSSRETTCPIVSADPIPPSSISVRPHSARLLKHSKPLQTARNYTSVAYAIAPTEDEWVPPPARSEQNPSGGAQRDGLYGAAAPLGHGPELGQPLYSDEVYGEGGLVEQASWFSGQTASLAANLPSSDVSSKKRDRARLVLASSNATAKEARRRRVLQGSAGRLLSHKDSLVARNANLYSRLGQEHLGMLLQSEPSAQSAMHTFLGDLRKEKASSRAFTSLYDTVEAKGPSKASHRRRAWRHLELHLNVAAKHWKWSPEAYDTMDWRICYIMVLARVGKLDRAVGLASDVINRSLTQPDRDLVIPYLATLAELCVKAEQSEHVIKLVAADINDIFSQSLDSGSTGVAFLQDAHQSLRNSLAVSFTRIQDIGTWVDQQCANRIDENDTNSYAARRLSRVANAAVLARLSLSKTRQASLCYEAFARCGVEISPESSSRLWKALAEEGSVGQAWGIFCISKLSTMLEKEHRQKLSSAVLSRIVELACLRGDFRLAEVALDMLLVKPGKPSTRDLWDVLRAQANAGRPLEVERTLRRFHGDSMTRLIIEGELRDVPELGPLGSLQQDTHVVQVLVRAYAVAGTVTTAELWWDNLRTHFGPPRCEDFNAMIHLYSRRADLPRCQTLLEDMAHLKVEPNAITWTTMLGLYASSGNYRSATSIVNRMRDADLTLDAITISSILNVAIEAGKWTGVKEIYETLDPATRSDPAVARTMLKAMMLLGAPFKIVKRLFQETFPDSKDATSRAWSILIQSACDAGLLKEAQAAMEEMLTKAKARSQPNPYVFSILIAAHLRRGDLGSARKIFARMDDLGVNMTSVSYSLMLKMLLKDDTIDKESVHRFAGELLVTRPWRPVDNGGRGRDSENILAPVILDAASNRDTGRVEGYTRDLADRGELPSLSMSTILMDTYRKAGQVDKMQIVWDHIHGLALDIRESQGISAASNLLCIPLSIYLDGMTTACRHQKVFEVWQSLAAEGFGFDAQNWNHLAVAYVRSGQPEQAFEIVEDILLARADEVAGRRFPSVRRAVAPTPGQVSQSAADLPSPLAGKFEEDTAMRPPNRRHQYRARAEPLEAQLPSKEVITHIISNWRPSDLTWRPTFLTIAVLERAYAQLESNIPVMALLSGEEEEKELIADASTGDKQRSTPLVLLARLNHRYARTISLIMLHRRKRRSAVRAKPKKFNINGIQ